MRRPPLAWIATGLLAGVLLALLFAVRRPAEPLTAEGLAVARRRWSESGIRDYTLELQLAGALADRRRVEVRDGRVVRMTAAGAPAAAAAWESWSVEGLFAVLEQEIANAADPRRHHGVDDPAAVVLRVRFDRHAGYPAYFLRHVMGRRSAVEWTVVEFHPESG